MSAVALLLAQDDDAERLRPRVVAALAPLKFTREAANAAVRLGLSAPVTTIPDSAGNASGVTREFEFFARGTYIVRAAQRLHTAQRAGSMVTAMGQERKHLQRHQQAAANRLAAAVAIDRRVRVHGKTLGWYAVMDERTSAECRAANGRNFDATRRPPIGFPGTVHPHCRCKAGPPHKGKATVYEIPRRRAAS